MLTGRALLNESLVLGVFVLGLAVAARSRRRWRWPDIVVMYLMGLLFELLTAHMWRYHDIFLILPSSIDDDLSVLFPLGWAGWIMTTDAVAGRLADRGRIRSWWARHLVLMGVWLVIGDAAETLFYRIGMIEYIRDEATRVNYLLGQIPGLPPTVILAGYAVVPPLAVQFMRALSATAPRAGRAR